MKITESTVSMAAQRSYQELHSAALNVRIESGNESRSTPAASTQVQISDAGQAKATQVADIQNDTENDPKMLLIKSLIEMLTGREMKLFNAKLQGTDTQSNNTSAQPSTSAPSATPAAESAGGMAVDYREVHAESEAVSFQAAGVIKTSDGREITFNAELMMARSYREETSISVASGSLARQQMDPLVINYNAPAATLSDQTFSFDINTDGQQDNISLLNPGSAFLSLDLNNDGKINNGSELFGTKSGNGFADLASYDGDNNGWIDENDSVFSKLALWIKDATGSDTLVDLKKSGIGAIYLDNAKADFSLNNGQNQQLGQSRSMGVYLNENGSGGTVQQIDLAV